MMDLLELGSTILHIGWMCLPVVVSVAKGRSFDEGRRQRLSGEKEVLVPKALIVLKTC